MDEILGPLAVMVFFGWVTTAVLGHLRRTRITKAQVETRGKILEKISAGSEMIEFMASDAGKQLLEPLPTEVIQEDQTPKQYSRILRAIQIGVVLFALGLGFVFMPVPDGNSQEAVTVFSILGLALGAGFLLAGLASYLLSRSWGLLNDDPQAE